MDLMKGPMLIILTGLAGTGKSTVGEMIAKRIGGIVLSTDVIRRELFPKRTYSKEESRRTYEEMLERAAKLLSKKKSVILDATFSKEDYRNEGKDIARKTKSDWQVVEVTCDPKVIRSRFETRKKTKDPSEATYRVYLFTKKRYERPSGRHITIDNSGGPKETEKQVQKHF
jgi:predicted kinase